MSARWLLVCALAAEALPVLGRLRGPRMLGPRLVAGQLAGVDVGLLICGVGPTKAQRRTEEGLGALPAAGVLSFGTCGALRDALQVGDVVSATRVLRERREVAQLPGISGLPPVHVSTVGAAVTTPERRAELAPFAHICEMEASGVLAAAPGRQHAVLKVVSDQAGGDIADQAVLDAKLGWVRFQARTLRIVERELLPALEAWLPTTGEGISP